MTDLVRIGSETARRGFENEKEIAKKFNDWRTDPEARKWLRIMGYPLEEIEKVEAKVIPGHKADLSVSVSVRGQPITVQNISAKEANSNSNYNQIDKRWVRNYSKLWNLPPNVMRSLEIYCGEISPLELLKAGEITKEKYDSLEDKRRFFMNEFERSDSEAVLDFFSKNKSSIVEDVLKGRGEYAADWMLVTQLNGSENEINWVLADMDDVIKIFEKGDVRLSPKNNIKIGEITVQRKGGDNGRKTANMLQFKMNPCLLFDHR